MHIYEVLRRPIVTEKTMIQTEEDNKYTFEVDSNANKNQIKEAVETAFEVTVLDVNTINVSGKTRRWGRNEYQTSDWKKAIVTLAPGDSIQFFEGV